MLEKEVLFEKKGNVAYITVDRPTFRNALSVPIVEYMDSLVDRVVKDKDIHCLVIAGGGEKAFIAGADIAQLVKMTPEESRYSIEAGHKLFTKIENLPIPTIAAINGYCLGGGLEIAMCCDIRVCSANAKFGQPEINIGMIAGWGATLRLPRLIGESRAKKLILTGRMITANEALSYGLVTDIYETVSVMRERVQEMGEELAKKAPVTMKTSKRMIHDARNKDVAEIAHRDELALAYIYTTEDAIEGLKAFLEKREPNYIGK